MNLVRAISLGRVGGDLRGNDSTGLICHVQLCLLAIDWILNILADNFLRDPLGLLIIFILQVFLLIIGLIFYLMSSANQAMKQGIHQKILRHHQVTIVMWTIYFSMLIWWYIWALKRSWPSAGEHFSFIFTAPSQKSDLYSSPGDTATEDDENLLSTSTERINESVLETIFGTTFKSVTTPLPVAVPPSAEALTITTPPSSTDWPTPSNTIPNPFEFRSTSPGISILRKKQNSSAIGAIVANTPLIINDILRARTKSSPQNGHLNANLLLSPQQSSKSVLASNSTLLETGNVELVKFFWSPGFIAVYAIERSISLLFYVAYILGTLHIINAHLIDDEDKDDIFHNSTSMSSSYNMNDLSSRRTKSSSGFRNKSNNIGTKGSFAYDTATSQPFQAYSNGRGGFIESDSNVDMDDNFIRQLEDQEGDPFENEQYQYQYQIKRPGSNSKLQGHGQGQKSIRFHRDRRHPLSQLGLDSDETDEADNRNIDVKNKPKHLKSKRAKGRKTSVTKLEKTKGALRSMMMMSNVGHFPSNNNNAQVVTVVEQGNTKNREIGENSNHSNANSNSNSAIYMTQSSVTVGNSFSPENRNKNRNNVTTAIVTASNSIDTIYTGSGSTDELLVAEVFTRSSNNNNNGNHRDDLRGIDGFMDKNDNDFTDTENSDDEDRPGPQNKKLSESASAIRANLSNFSPKDEKAFTKRKM